MKNLSFYIVIPAHNEEAYLKTTLQSLVTQSLLPKHIVVVDDSSTDNTLHIAQQFSDNYNFVSVVSHNSTEEHLPGTKVVNAFNKGLESLDGISDIICKFDADLKFPKNYLERVAELFLEKEQVGMASGILHIEKNGRWEYENIADKNHIRGPIKAYRKACFEAIGGLKLSIGWDTVDVLLAKYNGWITNTDPKLIVQHLKPTGANYQRKGYEKQGEALYKMRYGFWITAIAALKMTINKKDLSVFADYLNGYNNAFSKSLDFIVSEVEGRFIRKYRWKTIRKKLFG